MQDFLIDAAGVVINPAEIATIHKDEMEIGGRKYGSGRAVVILNSGRRQTLRAKYEDLVKHLAPKPIAATK